ncbi:MAG: hypothetical protein KDD67_17005 [Ignavibacteriae bacterium]|nr:hypothetical protein [Ignavibacteriota bacterium]
MTGSVQTQLLSRGIVQKVQITILTLFTLSTLLFFLAPTPGLCDTTIVVWNRQRIDYEYRVDFTRLYFPDMRQKYKRVIMSYRIECPRTGCDPWDRLGEVFILDPVEAAKYPTDSLNPLYFDVSRYELGRYVTPYGEEWSWERDVSHIRPLLHDSVTFGTYISIFKQFNHYNDPIGYLVSMSLRFEEGEPDFLATDVDLLWHGMFELGNPENPIESYLTPIKVKPSEEFAVVRVVASGHGQGNTDNAGEFMKKLHMLKAGNGLFAHELWRDDCGEVASGEQYGTWKLSRAGFCPGSEVYPWVNDVSQFYRLGESLTLDYDIEPYINLCRPGADPCPDCEENDLNSMPIIMMDAHVVYYRVAPSTPGLQDKFEVKGGASPETLLLRSRFGKPVDIVVSVLNPLGTVLYYQVFKEVGNQNLEIDLTTTPGRYLLKVETPEGTFRKMVEVGA